MIALQIANSCKVYAFTLRLCGVIQGSVSQTESHNRLKIAKVFRLLSQNCTSGKRGSVLCQLQQLRSPLQTSTLGRGLILLTACSSAPSEEEQEELAVGYCRSHSYYYSIPAQLLRQKRQPVIPADSHCLTQKKDVCQFQHIEPYEKIEPRGSVLSESLRNTDLQENKCTKDIINTENMQVLTKRCGVTCQVE